MGLKRQVARAFERITGAMVIHPSEFHQIPERMHLRRFFDHFGVDAVFDVGANRGQYAKQLREEVGFTGPIVSFEPMPMAVKTLVEAAAADPNWFIEELALDREAGPAQFNVMASETFSSLHAPAQDQPGIFTSMNVVSQEITVMRSTLAAELPKWRSRLGISRPFLKLDTQGHDLAVVEGAGPAIRDFVGLQSELSVRKLYADSADYMETIRAYEAKGFSLSAFVPNTAGHFPDLVELDCIMYRT